jgi:glycosyltransferase involved in cell wall biosynthesis
MRILFINTTDTAGGAAVVMQRLLLGLGQQYGTEHMILVRNKKSNAANTHAILHNRFEINTEKILDHITRPLGLLYQFFPFSSRRLLAAARSFKPDVINLHNTHGGYFATPLLEQLSAIAPVVWTLHDMWSFTGNASHTFGNMSWKELKNDAALKKIPPSIGINTGAFLLRQKKRVYGRSELSIVTPSKWLFNLAAQSPVFSGKKIYQVYNGIDPRVFFPGNKQEARKKLNIVPGEPVIIFISHFLTRNNPWKGGRDLLEILGRINEVAGRKITLLMLGEGTHSDLATFSNLDIVYTGYVHNDADLRDCLQAADLFIYPTRADNLPNVLVESVACGTPCITFDIGGSTEIVRHDFNGLIIEPFNFNKFAADALALLGDEKRLAQFSSNCLSVTRENFLLPKMVDAYYGIFKTISRSPAEHE